MEDLFTGLDVAEDIKTALIERIEKSKAEWIEGARNDSDFISTLRKEEAGKFFKTMEKAYKAQFPELDLTEIEGDGTARMKAILKAGVAKLQENKDATNQELQDKYLALNEQFSKYKEDEVPAMLNDERSKFHKRFIDEGILKDSLEFETVCKAESRPALVNAFVSSNGWRKAWNETAGDYEFLTADNLKPTKEDKPLSKKDIIEMALDDAGVLQKSNGTPDPTDPKRPDIKRKTGELSENAKKMLDTMPVENRAFSQNAS